MPDSYDYRLSPLLRTHRLELGGQASQALTWGQAGADQPGHRLESLGPERQARLLARRLHTRRQAASRHPHAAVTTMTWDPSRARGPHAGARVRGGQCRSQAAVGSCAGTGTNLEEMQLQVADVTALCLGQLGLGPSRSSACGGGAVPEHQAEHQPQALHSRGVVRLSTCTMPWRLLCNGRQLLLQPWELSARPHAPCTGTCSAKAGSCCCHAAWGPSIRCAAVWQDGTCLLADQA